MNNIAKENLITLIIKYFLKIITFNMIDLHKKEDSQYYPM